MFTLDGVPLIYNGMEVGDVARSDGNALFDKRDISWHRNEQPALARVYHDLIELRRHYAALRNSRVEWLHNSDETRLITFLRADEKDEVLVVINFSNRPLSGSVDLKGVGKFARVEISGMPAPDDASLPSIHLNGFDWCIYHRAAISSHSEP